MSDPPSIVHRSAGNTNKNIVRSATVEEGYRRDADNEDVALSSSPGTEPQQSKELPDCKVRRNYTCTRCDFFTQNPRQFLYHLRDVHREKVRVYECPDCIYASKHFQKLVRHRKMVHGTNNGCVTENPTTNTRASRRRNSALSKDVSEENPGDESEARVVTPHQPQTSSQDEEVFTFNDPYDDLLTDEYQCSVCDYAARSRQQLGKHEREEHIKTKFFRCAKCTYVTHIKARYTKHVKYHSMPMIKCELCDFRTPYKWNLDRHCKNHNGKGLFKCSACNFTADIKQSLTVHEMNHHTPPVGQAAGLGVGRRRINKVGASDTTDAEAAAAEKIGEASGQAEGNDVEMVVSDEVLPQQTPSQQITNGNYVNKLCNQCNFQTSSDAEMAKHESNSHTSAKDLTKKPVKKKRPIPNLIPIKQPSMEAMMSQADISDICSKSANSSLKDFASLFSAEDVFRNNSTPKVPDLIPTSVFNTTAEFKQKNASFFDKLKEKLELGTGCNLVCNSCGYESKCLTEHAKHQKACGKEANRVPSIMKMHNISASRCQYCRQRCKSSVDLFNHLQTCAEAIRQQNEEMLKQEQEIDIDEHELKIDEDRCDEDDDCETKPHPMENKVFVWNDIMVPMDIEVDDSNYEYTEDRADEISLDLSIRTQSPTNSESNTIISQESNNNISYDKSSNPSPLSTPTHSEKVPTHGNDISVAQHKRVFKCPHCTFWASTASRFHVHIVGHLNKKPFECSLCSYKSNWRWDITKHIKLKSVRDHAHESAKVLMTDETGRRNYTKYNKYLTEIPLSSLQSTNETSGGAGTRPRNQEKILSSGKLAEDVKVPPCGDTVLLRPKQGKAQGQQQNQDKKRSNVDNKRMLFKCKRCNHRDASKENLLQHVKEHYKQQYEEPLRYPTPVDQYYHSDAELSDNMPAGTSRSSAGASPLVMSGGLRESASALVRDVSSAPMGDSVSASLAVMRDSAGALNFSTQDLSLRGTSPDRDEASVNNHATGKGGTPLAPFRCGHCNQVSNWKHVIQRHCRLKHSGDIRVISNKNGQEKIEVDEQTEDADTEMNQSGAYRCSVCPFSSDSQVEFESHLPKHLAQSENNTFKCSFCKYYVTEKEDLLEHLKLHGVSDPSSFLESAETDAKKFRCPTCPYITNSKSQYSYHKTFHKARGGEFSCTHCSYNVSKRHLLHQHLKVHGINVTSYIKPSETDSNSEDKDVPLNLSYTENSQLDDIPLVWASKSGKFQKMYKCRFCPHVNVRRINIQDHEKMHGSREKNETSIKPNEVEHHCPECSYICNNAGVLSSHTKVHQDVYATVHCLVDPNKSEEEQIHELQIATVGLQNDYENNNHDNIETDESDSSMLYFCKECPGRFLKENEFNIHKSFHNSALPFRCDSCSYATQSNAYLMSHLNVHALEYQERTKTLQNMYNVSPNHPPPPLKPKQNLNGDIIYDVNSSKVKEITDLAHIYKKPSKFSQSVPLSGTDLFQQKSEAQLQQINLSARQPDKPDPITEEEYAILMQGNPEFTYATVLKNGRVKQKRYKCHKCPSAFEKREQYKIHLGLHGANQRYNCEVCDYSVKYYANFVQHKKKHKFSDDARLAKQENDIEIDDCIEKINENTDDAEMKLNVADQQIVNILQDRQTKEPEERKLHWCLNCPYVSTRRDAVESHQKRHASISGVTSSYACEHCDYSVPQAHYLRDHAKLHFVPNKINAAEGFMMCDNIKLTSNGFEASKFRSKEDDLVFEEHELKVDASEFSPPLNEELADKFNNNEDKKLLINVQNKNLVVKKENSDNNTVAEDKNNCQMEVN